MTPKLHITIPQPCHENWEAMTSVDKGKFCAACQKKVFDFTKASDREIITGFQQNQKLCGRFLPTQLNRDLTIPSEKSSFWLASTAAVISFLGIGTQEAKAQEPVKTEQTDHYVLLGAPEPMEQEEINISGVIKDTFGTLPGAQIEIKGSNVKTIGDVDGNFTIKVKKHDILVITYVGYSPIETEVINNKKLEIVLKESEVKLGGIVVLGGIHKKRTFFGRIFHSIGNWFR